MIILWIYLGVGLLNVVVAGFVEKKFHVGFDYRGWPYGWGDVVAYLLLWPWQALFLIVVGVHNATGWVLGRLFA